MEKRDSVAIFPHMKVGRYEFSRDKQVKYLGSTAIEKIKIGKEIAAKNVSGNKCFHGLSKILRSQSLSLEMKKQVYTTLISLFVTYGVYTPNDWGIRKKMNWKVYSKKKTL